MRYPLRGVMAAALCLLPAGLSDQPAEAAQGPPLTPQRIFETTCMSCHGDPDVKQAPNPSALRLMPAEALHDALASGAMHAQARQLTDTQRRGIAEYLAGRNMTTDRLGEASRMPNICASNPPIRSLTQGPGTGGAPRPATDGCNRRPRPD
jgi:mono/diheme cytochrome c family protein